MCRGCREVVKTDWQVVRPMDALPTNRSWQPLMASKLLRWLLGFWKDVCTSVGVLERCVHFCWGFGKMCALLLGFWKDVCTSIGVLERCVHFYWGFGKMCALLLGFLERCVHFYWSFGKMCALLLGFWKDVCTSVGVLESCVHFCVRICYRDMCILKSVITSYLTENTIRTLYKYQSFNTTW